MNFNVIPQEQYDLLVQRIEIMHKELSVKQKNPNEVIYDSQALMELLNISKSTLQKMRDEGYLGFSQVNGKFFYRQSDINEMIEKNYKPAFR
jgi:hypothetical protein